MFVSLDYSWRNTTTIQLGKNMTMFDPAYSTGTSYTFPTSGNREREGWMLDMTRFSWGYAELDGNST